MYEGDIPPWWAALQSDLIRVDLMIKYGGVYTDTDAIWVKPLSIEERRYDAVASYDWVGTSGLYHYDLNYTRGVDPCGTGGHVPPIFGPGGHDHECPPQYF